MLTGKQRSTVIQWYKDIVRVDQYMKNYQVLKVPSQEQQFECIQYLYKKIIFKNEIIGAYFEKHYLRWNENKPIIRSMVLKTLKNFHIENPLELQPLSYNEDDDFKYVDLLFSETRS